MREKLTLIEALDIYYNSYCFRPVDRYVETENGILLFRRETRYNVIRMECGHYLVRNNGKVEPTNPISCRFDIQKLTKVKPTKPRTEKMFNEAELRYLCSIVGNTPLDKLTKDQLDDVQEQLECDWEKTLTRPGFVESEASVFFREIYRKFWNI